MFLRKRRTPQAPHSTLGGFRGQGVSRPAGAKVVHVRAGSRPTPAPPHPTPPTAVPSSRQPRFLWMWSLALANLTAQGLSRNWVCAPALADKRRVGVAMRRSGSQVVSRPDKARPRQEGVHTAGCPGHLRRPGTARADLAGLGGTYRNQLHCPFKTRIFQSHFQI